MACHDPKPELWDQCRNSTEPQSPMGIAKGLQIPPATSTRIPSPPAKAQIPGRCGMQGLAIQPAISHAGPLLRPHRCHSFILSTPQHQRNSIPCLTVLAGNPVDFELFSGSIKQGLQTGIKGISLCCALWESCNCSLCSLSSLVCAARHTWMMPWMGNLFHGNQVLFLFLLHHTC